MPTFSPEAREINERYSFTNIGQKLAPHHWHRNLATLWYLEDMFRDIPLPRRLHVLEPGCQNFSRLPSLRTFFGGSGREATFTGIELDAFVPIRGFYSLWDHAQYYMSLGDDGAEFLADDFFKFYRPSEVIVCFYPFVSAAPALAWGLPATIAGAEKWIAAFERNLNPGGYVFVVHQGPWEEQDFDEARKGSHLQLVRRHELKCPFFSTKHPAHGSLYQKMEAPAGREH